MKTILLTVALGGAVAAWSLPAQGQPNAQSPAGQQSAQPAQGSASQAPVIKDPAEYNAYVAAVGQKDNTAKISGLEAFLTQYPNSVMKVQALELLMGTYQQTGNIPKTTEAAQKLVAADSCNERGLALLAYFDRIQAQSGAANAQQLLADGKKYGQQGLECLPKVTDPELLKNKNQMEVIFDSAIGVADLQDKDYTNAAAALKKAVDANPTDFSVVYPLALSYLSQNPPDYQNGIWFAARAAAVAPASAQAQIEKYARSQYVKFHAGDDGWSDVLAAAKANGPQVPIKPAPTPAEQAHNMMQGADPTKMDFATWEFILTNGSADDQALIWNAIKGKAVQMVGAVISTTPTQFMIAGSSDDITAKKADITLNFEDKIPPRLIPKEGDENFQFQGEPSSYTSNPFMMVMDKGELLRAKTPPARRAPVHHKPSSQ
jgi:tetratricopeptide (TPR) repeat protein